MMNWKSAVVLLIGVSCAFDIVAAKTTKKRQSTDHPSTTTAVPACQSMFGVGCGLVNDLALGCGMSYFFNPQFKQDIKNLTKSSDVKNFRSKLANDFSQTFCHSSAIGDLEFLYQYGQNATLDQLFGTTANCKSFMVKLGDFLEGSSTEILAKILGLERTPTKQEAAAWLDYTCTDSMTLTVSQLFQLVTRNTTISQLVGRQFCVSHITAASQHVLAMAAQHSHQINTQLHSLIFNISNCDIPLMELGLNFVQLASTLRVSTIVSEQKCFAALDERHVLPGGAVNTTIAELILKSDIMEQYAASLAQEVDSNESNSEDKDEADQQTKLDYHDLFCNQMSIYDVVMFIGRYPRNQVVGDATCTMAAQQIRAMINGTIPASTEHAHHLLF